jgi:hypothetical protein
MGKVLLGNIKGPKGDPGGFYNSLSSFYGSLDPTGAVASDAAIANWIEDCESTGTPGFVPPGTYKVIGQMNWKIPGLTVIGAGSNVTKFVQATANTGIVAVAGQAQEISGLQFGYASQEAAANTNSIGMSLGDDTVGSCFMSRFTDLLFTQCQRGMAVNPALTTKAGLFSCHFDTMRFLGYSYSALHLIGDNGTGGANATGCVFDNTYVHNNFSGSDANSTWWPVYLQAWDEVVFNQLNVEHAQVFNSEPLAFVSVGNAVVNGLHLEHLELSGNPGWGHIYASHATSVEVNGLSIRFPTMTGTSYNSIIRLNGTEGPEVTINGLNEPSDSGATYNSNHPLVDFGSATNGRVVLKGVSASKYTGLQINAGTGCSLDVPNLTPGAWTSFGTGGFINVLNTSSGFSLTPAAGTWYYSQIYIPEAIPVSGILAPVDGGTGGTDKWIAALWKSTGGAAIANSATAGTTTPATGNKFKLPFTSAQWLAPGVYIVGMQSNGTSAKMECLPNNLEAFVTGSVTGTFGTVPSLTPASTYTANVGPMVSTY